MVGGIGNSRRRGQTRVLTLCKHAVTTLVRETSVLTSTEHGLPRNWIFRLKAGIKYIGIVTVERHRFSRKLCCLMLQTGSQRSLAATIASDGRDIGIYSRNRNFELYFNDDICDSV